MNKIEGVSQYNSQNPVYSGDPAFSKAAKALSFAHSTIFGDPCRREEQRYRNLSTTEIFYNKHLDSSDDFKEFQGLRPSFAMHSYLKDLEAFQPTDNLEAARAARGKLQVSHNFNMERETLRTCYFRNLGTEKSRKAQLNKLISSISEAIKNLENGGKLVLQGGTINHAVLYEIEKRGDSFSFTVLNTGNGATYAEETDDGYRLRNYTIDNIREEHISGEVFLSDLFAYQFKKLGNTELSLWERFLIWIDRDKTNPMPYVYQTINKHLLNEGRGIKRPKEQCTRYRAQKSGTCACRVIETWLAIELGPELFKSFKQHSLQKDTEQLAQIAEQEQLQRKTDGWINKILAFLLEPPPVKPDTILKIVALGKAILPDYPVVPDIIPPCVLV